MTQLGLTDANQLFLDGARVFARIEQNGIRIDMDYCHEQKAILEKRCRILEDKFLASTDLGLEWLKAYGERASPGNNLQLADVLYKRMGIKLSEDRKTEKGHARTDERTLEGLDIDGVPQLLRLRGLAKTLSTYIEPLLRESVQHRDDGLWYVHPFFSLNMVTTYRSSSSNPNFQNQPIRDKEIAEIVRRAFVPRPGRQIGSGDFKGVEVGVGACYHKDQTMIDYLLNPTKDMHRDMAMECYLIEHPEQVNKTARYSAKNGFVFPQFYGDRFWGCALAMWGNCERLELEVEGVPMLEHLAGREIRDLQQFERHMEKVEARFWNERFLGYKNWKEQWWHDYCRQGFFNTLTGFRCSGVMTKKEVCNYPVQGSAFHCLLRVLIWLQDWLDERGMETKIIGQIHDNIVDDRVPEEGPEVEAMIRELVEERLPKEWPWIIVPMRIETEYSEINGNWFEMRGT